MKNDNALREAESIKKLSVIAAKLAFVKTSGELLAFRIDWIVPDFSNIREMEDWIRLQILEKGQWNSYHARLEKIANQPQVSIKPGEMHYLEYFLLMEEVPPVTVSENSLEADKKDFELNRKWETSLLFHRLNDEKEQEMKFTELAAKYSKLMPEEAKRIHGSVNPVNLRKAYSRGLKKANSTKKDY